MDITLTPAYGRDYRNKESAINAFLEDKDFVIRSITHRYYGKYCSIRDLKGNYDTVYIRYNGWSRIAVVNLKEID